MVKKYSYRVSTRTKLRKFRKIQQYFCFWYFNFIKEYFCSLDSYFLTIFIKRGLHLLITPSDPVKPGTVEDPVKNEPTKYQPSENFPVN